MRENVLREMAGRAVGDPDFLRRVRQDPGGTLASYGYKLTEGEMRLVEDLRRRTVGMTDEELVRTLSSGLEGRSGTNPASPAAPRWRGSGPARPARPGG